MEKTKHTPGPWTLSARPTYQSENDKAFWFRDVVNEPRTVRIARVSGVGEDRAMANARLIAAAPDLLEACKWALAAEKALPEITKGIRHPALENALICAIAKAGGRE